MDQITSGSRSTTTVQTGFAGSTQECLSEQEEQAALLINKVLTELKGACPGWRSSIATKEDYDSMRQQWLIGFLENGITSDLQINEGMSKARKYNKPFLPSIGQFIEWCNLESKEKYPPLEVCMTELIQFVKNGRKDTYNLSPFMYHTVTRNLDLYNYKLMEREYDRVKAFEVAYKATLFQLETGNELAKPPAPETLLESRPVVVNETENVKKGSAVINDLLSMFDTPEKEARPLSKADIEDLQRLEKIRNE